MKGIVFNLLEEFITSMLGEEKYEEIVAGCDLKTKGAVCRPGHISRRGPVCNRGQDGCGKRDCTA